MIFFQHHFHESLACGSNDFLGVFVYRSKRVMWVCLLLVRTFACLWQLFTKLRPLSNESENYTRGKLTCPEHSTHFTHCPPRGHSRMPRDSLFLILSKLFESHSTDKRDFFHFMESLDRLHYYVKCAKSLAWC